MYFVVLIITKKGRVEADGNSASNRPEFVRKCGRTFPAIAAGIIRD
jgi:hypothetical protein